MQIASCLLIKKMTRNAPAAYTADEMGGKAAKESAHLLERILGGGKDTMWHVPCHSLSAEMTDENIICWAASRKGCKTTQRERGDVGSLVREASMASFRF